MNKKILSLLIFSIFSITFTLVILIKPNPHLENTSKVLIEVNETGQILSGHENEGACLDCKDLKQHITLKQNVLDTEINNSQKLEKVINSMSRFGEIGSHSSYEISEFHANDSRGITNWSVEKQDSIYQTLFDSDFQKSFTDIGVGVGQIECKTSTCKIDISSTSIENIKDFKKQFEIQKSLISRLKKNNVIATSNIQVVSKNHDDKNMSMYYYWPEQDKED